MKLKNYVLIFSDHNQRAVISFCRFATRSNIKFAIVANGREDEIFSTIYKKKVFFIREKNVLDINNMKDIITKLFNIFPDCQKVVILPTTEYLNRFILKHRNIIEEWNTIIPLCNQTLYENISDKYIFGNICKTYKIKVPEEIPFTEIQKTSTIVAKPKKYFSKNKMILSPVIINTPEAFDTFKKHYFIDDFYFQEFIAGESYYLLYYFPNKTNFFSLYSQKNLMQQADGKSIIAAKTSKIHLRKNINIFSEMLLQLNFHGLLMIEIRKRGKDFFMIEANPRLWGPSQLIIDAEMDLFYKFSLDYHLIESIPNLKYKNKYYFWYGGLMENIKENKKIVIHNNFTINTNIFSKLIKTDIYARKDTDKIFFNKIISGEPK